jgi:nitrate/TMAO reductase-like tetraheme cytochrome c subunit
MLRALLLTAALPCLTPLLLLSVERGSSSAGPADPADPHLSFATDAESCGTCHKVIYEQWKGTSHAEAWSNPLYQASLIGKRRPESCYGCHIPVSIHDHLGKRPPARQEHKHEGVGCAACHVHQGKVLGSRGTETEAHPGERSKAFGRKASESCRTCHSTKIGPVLPLGRDFEEAGFVKSGKTCRSCHMPRYRGPIANDPDTGEPVGKARRTRSHVLLGPTDKELMDGAFAFDVDATGARPILRLHNKAGHRIPGLLFRYFEAKFVALDADGKEIWQHEATISGRKPIPVREMLRIEGPERGRQFRVEVRHVLRPDFDTKTVPGVDEHGVVDYGVVFTGDFPKKQ